MLWQARQGPWENGAFSGPNSGLFKSTDGGTTWKQITGGLPSFAQGLGRIGIGIAPSDPARMYALVESRENGGLYRSDDAGASWRLVNREERIYGRGNDFAVRERRSQQQGRRVRREHVYLPLDRRRARRSRRSRARRAATTITRIWINPAHPEILLLASDQGATISVNGGATWSSWYNQPTAQFYHVITDNQFPYWVYGGQQESGSVGIVEPRQRRRDHVSRLASRRRGGVRATSRPTRCIRTSSMADG